MALGRLDPATIAAVQQLWASSATPVSTQQPTGSGDGFLGVGTDRQGLPISVTPVELTPVDDAALEKETQDILRFIDLTWNMSVTHIRSKRKLNDDDARPLLTQFIKHALKVGIKEGETIATHKLQQALGRPETTDGDMLINAILTQAKRGYRFRGAPKRNLTSWPQFDGIAMHKDFAVVRMDFRNTLALDTSDEPGLRIEPLLRAVLRQGMSLTLYANEGGAGR